ncbi:hypothetical protein BBBOND_0402550 [Babesia bigemina]|uniref:Uncharacterized protein n=1 Tax=Babesia bigemina TaxID=5866 RepID=A0A061DCF6_BABBI|nr:hypothetical protein BBBOND_0402550 [Babesia bigemina]CDR97767.1 hypothetical protein BBBOND_0402550 [Babesia bigemina]|eukprot:XP_012769953.1 hypothetical protein BBBOND_0402550 [Babesia bigemina]
MVHKSLTDLPRNLKEGIDWLLAVKGDDGESNLKALGAAVYDFLAQQPLALTNVPSLENIKLISMGFMWNKELRDLWPANVMLGKFIHSADKKADELADTMGTRPEKVAANIGTIVHGVEKFLDDIKHPAQYKSAYGHKATWDRSCAKNPEDCAAIFVGIAPMLYVGLESLRDASESASGAFLSDEISTRRFRRVFKAMGYRKRRLRPNIGGPDFLKALSNVQKDVLSILDDVSGFDDPDSALDGKSKADSILNDFGSWPKY